MISATLLRSACADALDVDFDRCETVCLNHDYDCEEVTGPRAVKLTAGSHVFKCYECPTEEHAAVVQLLSTVLPPQGIPMPRCYGVHGSIVLAEWVQGTPLNEYYPASDVLERMAAYHARLHDAVLPQSVTGWSMPQVQAFFEGVRKFARRAGLSTITVADFADRFMADRPRNAPHGVLHTDFVPSNLIVTPDGSIISVDNEFLCVGYGREWDILNTVKSMRRKPMWASRYLERYAHHGSLHTLLTHRDYWETIYHLRMAAKRLSEGRLDEGRNHVRCVFAQES